MKTRKYEGYWNFGFRVSIRTLKLSVFELFSQIDVIYQNKIKIMQVHCFCTIEKTSVLFSLCSKILPNFMVIVSTSTVTT